MEIQITKTNVSNKTIKSSNLSKQLNKLIVQFKWKNDLIMFKLTESYLYLWDFLLCFS